MSNSDIIFPLRRYYGDKISKLRKISDLIIFLCIVFLYLNGDKLGINIIIASIGVMKCG